jgi:putative ABC transport system permease protein
MTPLQLAWANLIHKRTRTFIAAAGVAFAVTLIFMELGLLGGVGRTATMLFDKLQFDLLLTSSEYLDLSRPGQVPRLRLAQAHIEGVERVLPLSFGAANWRAPARRSLLGRTIPAGEQMSINIVAAPPEQLERIFTIGPGEVFPTPEAARAAGGELTQRGTFLLDERSKPEFGDVDYLQSIPPDGRDGDLIRVNGRRARIVGRFAIGTGFSWNGLLLTSETTYEEFTFQPSRVVTFGLVTLQPGADPVAVQRRLYDLLPPDVQVFTRAEINRAERNYWLRLTSVGQFLVVAVILAVVVGIIFVYQMMAADIRNMLPEYATVKALGYRSSYLTAVVLWQAVLLAGFGYVPGFVAAMGFYAIATRYGGIPTGMTAEIALGVLLLTGGMCLVSGVLALRKVHTADPADLF